MSIRRTYGAVDPYYYQAAILFYGKIMSLFSQESTFTKFMNRLTDVCCLNILWIVFSLPVITIGASTAAAYSVVLKMISDEESYVAKSFIQAFKNNFKQGTILWFLTMTAFYALYIDIQLVFKSERPSIILCVVSILSFAGIFCIFVYAYPLAARYDNTLWNDLHNSFSISMKHPVKTFILLIVCAFEIYIFTFNMLMMIFGILAGPMILVYTVSGTAKNIFLKIERDGGVKNPLNAAHGCPQEKSSADDGKRY
jgi:uncharacterized membrane protein YesL